MPTINTDTPKLLTPEEMKRNGSTNGDMGKDAFLKLFVAQLQHQDPMNPMDDSQFMGQMASFSTLEQVTNLAVANEQVAANLTASNAVGLIGRTVSYVDENDQIHTGKVDKVTTAGGKPSLTVDGVDGVDPATITQVA
jgi:flagellar basal-body rod modification protein FlgD